MTQTDAVGSRSNGAKVNSPFESPFDAARDSDRHAIWEALVARDSEAFAAIDWSICDGDFAPGQFDGISAHGSFDPLKWSLRYPTVESYRVDWTAMAHSYAAVALADVSHREL